MARVFITGAADGLGLMAAKLLLENEHNVVAHVRNEQRAKETDLKLPKAEAIVTGDLSSIAETIALAETVNRLGEFDAIIHNAAIGYREPQRVETLDGLPHVFAVNSLSPYILTCLIHPPKRLIYLSSSVHPSGNPSLKDLLWLEKRWSGYNAYADSKLHDTILAFAVARKWPSVYSNAVDPGWVATKMGGAGAPDSLEEAPKTQVWLATSDDPKALVSGKYFYHQQQREAHPAASEINVQESFLAKCEDISGIKLPSYH